MDEVLNRVDQQASDQSIKNQFLNIRRCRFRRHFHFSRTSDGAESICDEREPLASSPGGACSASNEQQPMTRSTARAREILTIIFSLTFWRILLDNRDVTHQYRWHSSACSFAKGSSGPPRNDATIAKLKEFAAEVSDRPPSASNASSARAEHPQVSTIPQRLNLM